MADYVGWDSVPKSGSSGEKSEYLKLESGRTYRIRPVFDPVIFFKYFHTHAGRLRTAICADPKTCSVRDRHPELKAPSMRFAAYVIDRADGKVKILEAPQTVFRPIGASFTATGKNPGSGADGSDWQITVIGKGINTKYEVTYAGPSPITKEERNMIKEAMDADLEKLKKLYKNNTPEEIEEKLFGDWKKSESDSKTSTINSVTHDDFGDDTAQDGDSGDSGDSDDFDNNW